MKPSRSQYAQLFRAVQNGPLRTETELEGSITEFTYQSADGTFSVAKFVPEREKEKITLVGAMTGLDPGERIRVKGRWTEHSRFGARFEVESFVPILPSTLAALEHYIGHKLVKGIGPRTAARIVRLFGEDIFNVLESAPARLMEVPGLKRAAAESLAETWQRKRDIHDLMIFLQGMGLSPRLAGRLFHQYGRDTVKILRTNPYRAALEVRQVGFKTADAIARKVGIALDSPERAQAGVLHVLATALAEGHTCLPVEELIRAAAELLQAEEGPARAAFEFLREDQSLLVETLPEIDDAAFLPSIHTCEAVVAREIRTLLATEKPWSVNASEDALAAFEADQRIELAPEQREAVRRACAREGGGALVVTGGPGTGKTTLVRAILALLRESGLRISLCAPTGRAAQRLAETTGQRASTIHRLLKFSPDKGFFHSPSNPLEVDFLIVDETSMVDIPLAYHLLRAVPASASVLFVGDADQLPSVGPGNFLRDLIDSETVPVVRLEKIFRQSQRSLIVVNAHRINQGRMPLEPREDHKNPDFFFIEREKPEECLDALKRLVSERIPAKFHFDPINDVQVLTPMHRGPIGVQNINRELQDLLNPGGLEMVRGAVRYRRGDKVMQLVNNYDEDVFNGDVGTVVHVGLEAGEVGVRYGHRVVNYSRETLDQLTPAYACTIHKCQGSEYKAVVVLLHTQHYIMLQRNLLYTAVTRGKKLVCLIGNRRAMAIAVRNMQTRARYSALRHWIRREPPSHSLLPRASEDDIHELEIQLDDMMG